MGLFLFCLFCSTHVDRCLTVDEKDLVNLIESHKTSAVSPADFVLRHVGDRFVVYRFSKDEDLFNAQSPQDVNPFLRAALYQKIVQDFGDVFDEVFMVSGFEYFNFAAGFRTPIKNSVTGIGRDLFDSAEFFGSSGRLSGFSELGEAVRFLSVNPDAYRQFETILLHELGHRWLAHIQFLDAGIPSNALLHGTDPGHWNFLLDSSGSFMYGNSWIETGLDQFVSAQPFQTYSPLDLYLMGFYEADEVDPFVLLSSLEIQTDNGLYPSAGQNLSATQQFVTLQQVIDAEGIRVPSASRQELKAIFVVLEGESVFGPSVFPVFSTFIEAVSRKFQRTTSGRGLLDFHVPHLKGRTNQADLDLARIFLLSRETNGLFSDHESSKVRDTTQVLRALRSVGLNISPYLQVLQARSDQSLEETAYVSRLLSEVGQNDISRISNLIANQRADGSFALRSPYLGNLFDTVLAGLALHEADLPQFQDAIQASVSWVLAQQSQSGLWGQDNGTIYESGLVLEFFLRQNLVSGLEVQTDLAFSALDTMVRADGMLAINANELVSTAQYAKVSQLANRPNNVFLQLLETTQSDNGSWNAGCYSTAMALEVLANAQFPDLSIDSNSIILMPENAGLGDMQTVNGVFENIGSVAADNVVLDAFLRLPDQSTLPLESQNWPTLAPATQQIFSFQFNHPTDLSAYDLVIQLTTTTPESNSFNNQWVRPYIHQAQGPDLGFEATAIQPINPVPNESAILVCEVVNIGTVEASSFNVQIAVDPPSGPAITIYDQNHAALIPGSTLPIQLSWIPSEIGLHQVTFSVTATGDVNLENNLVLFPVNVQPAYAGVDLAILANQSTGDVFTLFDTIPKSIDLQFNIFSLGTTTPPEADLTIYSGHPSQGGIVLTTQTIVLPTSNPRQISVVIDWLTQLDLWAEITPVGAPDGRLLNNLENHLIDLRSHEDLEWVNNSLTITPNPSVVGQPVQVEGSIVNRHVASRNTTVRISLDDGTSIPIQNVPISLPGKSTTSFSSVIEPNQIFTGNMVVSLDPDQVLDEIDEDDQGQSLPFQVNANLLGNLHINPTTVLLDPPPHLQGEPLEVSIDVSNNGNSALNDIMVHLRLDHQDGLELSNSVNLASLSAGAAHTFDFTVDPVTFSGSHYLVFVAETTDPELRLDDNIAFIPILVQGAANLSISDQTISLEPYWPGDGESTTLTVDVANTGATTASNATIELRANQIDGPLLDSSVHTIGPGTLTINFTFTAAPDISSLVLTVDPANEIAESNESDNLASIGFSIRNGDFGASQPYISPNNDGVQDQLTLYWDLPISPLRLAVFDRKNEEQFSFSTQLGQGSITVDGKDPDGEALPDGAYFARLFGPNSQLPLRELTFIIDTNRTKISEALAYQDLSWNLSTQQEYVMPGDTWFQWGPVGAFLYSRSHDDSGSGPEYTYQYQSPDQSLKGSLWVEETPFSNDPIVGPRLDLSNHANPGFVWFQSDDLSGDMEYLLYPHISFPSGPPVATFTRPVADEVLAWVQTDKLLVKSGGSVGLVDTGASAFSPLPMATPWHDGFVDQKQFGDELYFLIELQTEFVLAAIDLNTLTIRSLVDWSKSEFENSMVSVLKADSSWILAAKDTTNSISDLYFFDPSAEIATGWTDIFSEPPDDARLLTDGLHVLTDNPWNYPPIQQITNWKTLDRFHIPTSQAEYLKGLFSPDNLHVANIVQTGFDPEQPEHSAVMAQPSSNMVLDFEATVSAQYAVRLQGTVSDRYLKSWQLEYADGGMPDMWIPTALLGTRNIRNAYIATWIPPQAGSYFLRITATDLAGNRIRKAQAVQVASQPLFGNVSPSSWAISPNLDGVQDELHLQFEVFQLPFEAQFRVKDDAGSVVYASNQTIASLGPAQWVWDGSGLNGVAPDGTYQIELNGIPFEILVDTLAPNISFQIDDPIRQRADTQGRCIGIQSLGVPYDLSIDDQNLTSWHLEKETAAGLWQSLQSGSQTHANFQTDNLGNILRGCYRPQLWLEDSLNQNLRLIATDAAGNQTVLYQTPMYPQVVWTLDGTSHQTTFDAAGSDLGDQPYTALQQLVFVATLPADRFPIDLTAIHLNSSRITDFYADSRQFESAIMQPRIDPTVIPFDSQQDRYRLEFEDANGSTYLTEWLTESDVQFEAHNKNGQLQLSVISREPIRRVEGIFLGAKSYQDSQTQTYALEAPFELAYNTNQGGQCGNVGESFTAATISFPIDTPNWLNELPPAIGLVSFQFADLRLETDFGVLEFSDIMATSRCDELTFKPIAECRSLPELAFEVFKPTANESFNQVELQFFSDANSLNPISPLMTVAEITRLVIPFTGSQSRSVFLRSTSGAQSVRWLINTRDPSFFSMTPFALVDDNRSQIVKNIIAPTAEIQVDMDDPIWCVPSACEVLTGKAQRPLTIQQSFLPTLPAGYQLHGADCIAESASCHQLTAITAVNASSTVTRNLTFEWDDDQNDLLIINIIQLRDELDWDLVFDFQLPNGTCASHIQTISFDQSAACSQDSTLPVTFAPSTPPTPVKRFSPNDDGQQDQLNWTLNIGSNATLRAFIATQAGQPVRLIRPWLPVTSGTLVLAWDGKNELDQVLADGSYRLHVISEGCGGRQSELQSPIILDTQPPAVLIHQPLSGAVLLPNDAVVSVNDESGIAESNLRLTSVADPSQSTLIWTSQNQSLDQASVVSLSSTQPGLYDLLLEALDKAGNTSNDLVQIELFPNDVIRSFECIPRVFSPNNDGIADQVSVSFYLEEPATVTLSVAGSTSGNILVNQPMPVGQSQISFDGTIGAQALMTGSYSMTLSAQTTGVSSALLTFKVDVNRPQVSFAAPTPDQLFEVPNIELEINVSDPQLQSWLLTGTFANGHIAPIYQSSNEANALIIPVDLMVDGPTSFMLHAQDTVGNWRQETRTVELDTLPPILTVEPLTTTVFEPGESVTLTAEWSDEHPESMEIVLDSQLVFVQSLGPQTSGSLNMPFDVPYLPEDHYPFLVRCSDSLGHVTERNFTVAVDIQPPQVSLLPPANNPIRSEWPIIGTAWDSNLDRFELELALISGGIPGPFQRLVTRSQPITQAELYRLAVLPPDGEYRLRLIAWDRQGRHASTILDFSVDRTPPITPVGASIQTLIVGQGSNRRGVVTLNWVANSESDLQGYIVSRNGILVSTLLEAPFYSDENLSNGSWTYQIQAIDLAGNQSLPTTPLTAIVDILPPNLAIFVPEYDALVGTQVTIQGSVIDLHLAQWTLMAGAGSNPTNWSTIQTSTQSLPFGSLGTWNPISLTSGIYQLRLFAEDLFGNQAESRTQVSLDSLAPEPPGKPTVILIGNSLYVNWTWSVSPDVMQYIVYANGGRNGQISDPPFEYVNPPDGTYVFEVASEDLAGNKSALSVPSDPYILDRNAPHAIWVQPVPDTRFDSTLNLFVRFDAQDIDTAEFQYREASQSWTTITTILDPPWNTIWDATSLADGLIELRCLATDLTANTDPAPTVIQVEKGDIDPPQPPSGVTAVLMGDEVQLNWDLASDLDLAETLIFRDQLQIAALPIPQDTYADSAIQLGEIYSYQLQSKDNSGNLSPLTAPIEVRIQAVTVETPPSLYVQQPFELVGVAPAGYLTVTVSDESTPIQTVNVEADRSFSIAVGGLQQGLHVLSFQAKQGTTSATYPLDHSVQISGDPDPVTQLEATINADIPPHVELTWVEPISPIEGYRICKNGEHVDGNELVTPLISQFTSTFQPLSLANMIDGSDLTLWQSTGDSEVFMMTFNESVQLGHLVFDWDANGAFPHTLRIEAWLDGEWFVISDVPIANTARYDSQYFDPLPGVFSTDFRLTLNASSAFGIWEFEWRQPTTRAAPLDQWTDPDDRFGIHTYEVKTVSHWGKQASKQLTIMLGDADPPLPPSNLSATVTGDEVNIGFTSSASPDVAFHRIRRNQIIRTDLTVPINSFQDTGLPVGSYAYTVTAVDNSGNESTAIGPVEIVITNSAVNAPILAANIDTIAKRVVLDWIDLNPLIQDYELLRKASSQAPNAFERVNSGPPFIAKTWIDRPSGGNFDYQVIASYQNGTSIVSNQVSIEFPNFGPLILSPNVNRSTAIIAPAPTDVEGIAKANHYISMDVDRQIQGTVTSSAEHRIRDLRTTAIVPDHLSLSSSGQWLAAADASTVEITDLINQQTTNLSVTQNAHSLKFDPLSRFLTLIDGPDQMPGTLRGFRLDTGQEWQIASVSAVSSFLWVDLNHVVFATGTHVMILDVSAGTQALLWISASVIRQILLDSLRQRIFVVTSTDPSEFWSLSFQGEAIHVMDIDLNSRVFAVPLSAQLIVQATTGQAEIWSLDENHQITGSQALDLPMDHQLVGTFADAGLIFTQNPQSTLFAGDRLSNDPFDEIGWAQTNLAFEILPASILIAQLDGPQTHIRHWTPAGYFKYELPPLSAGHHLLTARSTNPFDLTKSEPSSLNLFTSLTHLPDLRLDAQFFLALPTLAVPGDAISFLITASNQGADQAQDVWMQWWLTDSNSNISTPFSPTYVAKIDARTSVQSGQLLNTSPLNPGTYRMSAQIDPDNDIQEQSEDNNIAHREFYLQQAGQTSMEIAEIIDARAGDPVSFTTTIANTSTLLSELHLSVGIENEQGQVVHSFEPVTFDLPQNQHQISNWTWDPQQSFAGIYRVRARLDQSAMTILESTQSFDLFQEPDLRINLLAIPQPLPTAQAFDVQFKVSNKASHVYMTQLSWTLKVCRLTGELLSQDQGLLPNLLPGGFSNVDAVLSDLVVVPDVEVRVSVFQDGQLAAVWTEIRTVDPSIIQSANLGIYPGSLRPLVGTPLEVSARISNTGNQNLTTELTMELQRWQAPDFVTLTSENWQVSDLAPTQAAQQAWQLDSQSYTAGRHRLLLSSDQGFISDRSVEFDFLEDLVPRIVITGIPQLGVGEPDITPEITVVDNETPMPIAQIWLNQQPYTSGTSLSQDGAYLLEVEVTDQSGHFAAKREFFSIDSQAPQIDVLGIVDQGIYTDMVLPWVIISDPHLFDHTVLLDDMPYSLGTPIETLGMHLLAVTAIDVLGHQSQQTIEFEIISSPSTLLAFNGIQPNGLYNVPVIVNIDLFNGANLRGFEWLDQPVSAPLLIDQPGPNWLHAWAEAVDGSWTQHIFAQVIMDYTAPVIEVQGVANQHYRNDVTPIVFVDGAPASMTQLQLNGQPFQSGTPISIEGSYQLQVIAIDEAGNVAQASRDFVIDKTAPVIFLAGVQHGLTYQTDVNLTWNLSDPWLDRQEARLNGALIQSPFVVRTSGYYIVEILGTDLAGNSASEKRAFTLDRDAPLILISGVFDGQVTATSLTPIVDILDDDLTFSSVLLNGVPFTSGDLLTADNDYTLIVEAHDATGNIVIRTLQFSIDTVPPQIQVQGVVDGATYNNPVTPVIQINDAHPGSFQFMLDRVPFSSGTSVSALGNHTLTLRAEDLAGNLSKTQVNFTIEGEGAPIIQILGVQNSAFYNQTVFPDYSVQLADPNTTMVRLNQQPFVGGSPVSNEGNYLFNVEASNKFGTVIKFADFVIDQTPPAIQVYGVVHQAQYLGTVTPYVDISDTYLSTHELTLNGLPFISGTPLSQQGSYILTAHATDLAGNASESIITFQINAPSTIGVFPNPVDFGNAFVAGFEDRQLFIINQSPQPLVLDEWQIDGSQAAFFSILSGTPLNLGPYQSGSIWLRYQPSELGVHQALLAIGSTQSIIQDISIELLGLRSASVVKIPEFIPFGRRTMNQSATTQFLLQNLSNQDQFILDELIDGLSIFSTDLDTPEQIPANASQNVTAYFLPPQTGPYSAKLTWAIDDPVLPYVESTLCGLGAMQTAWSAKPRFVNDDELKIWGNPDSSDLFVSRGPKLSHLQSNSLIPLLEAGENDQISGHNLTLDPAQALWFGHPVGLFSGNMSGMAQVACFDEIKSWTWATLIDAGYFLTNDNLLFQYQDGLRQIEADQSLTEVVDICWDAVNQDLLLLIPNQNEIRRLDIQTGQVTNWQSHALLGFATQLVAGADEHWTNHGTSIQRWSLGIPTEVVSSPIQITNLARTLEGIYWSTEKQDAIQFLSDGSPTSETVWQRTTPLVHTAAIDQETNDLVFVDQSDGSLYKQTNGSVPQWIMTHPDLQSIILMTYQQPNTYLAMDSAGDLFSINSLTPSIQLVQSTNLNQPLALVIGEPPLVLQGNQIFELTLPQPTPLISLAGNPVDMVPVPGANRIYWVADSANQTIWEVDLNLVTSTSAKSLTFIPDSIATFPDATLWVTSNGFVFDAFSEQLILGPFPSQKGSLIKSPTQDDLAWLIDHQAHTLFDLLPANSGFENWRDTGPSQWDIDNNGQINVLDWVISTTRALIDLQLPGSTQP